MPHLDSTFTTTLWVGFLVACGLYSCFKRAKIKTYRIEKNSPSVKRFDNPDDAIKELEEIQDQIKHSNQSGAHVFMSFQNTEKNALAGDKPVEITVNNPEEEAKVLDDLKERIGQFQASGKEIKIVTNKKVVNASRSVSFSTLANPMRFNVRGQAGLRPLSLRRGVVYAIICFAVGLLLLFLGNHDRQLAVESINWPITEGHVIDSHNWNSLKEILFHHHPETRVKYSYVVNGQQYNDDTLAYNYTWAQCFYDVTKLYPLGATVKVRYLPENPRWSCLEIGSASFFGVWFYWSILLFAVALFFILQCLTYFQSENESSDKSFID